MGIVRETMNPQILEEKQGQLQFEDLIDLEMVAIIDNAREIGMNLLNNSINSMIDNFRSIKWLYHELEEFREKIGQLENKKKMSNCGILNDQGE